MYSVLAGRTAFPTRPAANFALPLTGFDYAIRVRSGAETTNRIAASINDIPTTLIALLTIPLLWKWRGVK